MTDHHSPLPARVSRQTAMSLLCIDNKATFRKVVDANPRLVHKLPGEKRAKYLTSVITELLSPNSRCVALREGANESATVQVRKKSRRDNRRTKRTP